MDPMFLSTVLDEPKGGAKPQGRNSKFAMVIAFAFQLGQNNEEWWLHDLCDP